MKKLTLYSKGLGPLDFHGTDPWLYQVPGHYIELLLLIIAACDWASLPCTRKHRWKLETIIIPVGCGSESPVGAPWVTVVPAA